jgi:hypothetical protein
MVSVYEINMNIMSLEIQEPWFFLILCHELYQNSGLVGNTNITIYSVKNYRGWLMFEYCVSSIFYESGK